MEIHENDQVKQLFSAFLFFLKKNWQELTINSHVD